MVVVQAFSHGEPRERLGVERVADRLLPSSTRVIARALTCVSADPRQLSFQTAVDPGRFGAVTDRVDRSVEVDVGQNVNDVGHDSGNHSEDEHTYTDANGAAEPFTIEEPTIPAVGHESLSCGSNDLWVIGCNLVEAWVDTKYVTEAALVHGAVRIELSLGVLVMVGVYAAPFPPLDTD